MDMFSAVMTALVGILSAWVTGLVVRRALGVPVGWLRATVAAGIALLISGQALQYWPALKQIDPNDIPVATILLGSALVVAVTIMLAMLLLVVWEMLVPDGSLPGPVELWRSWRARVSRTGRYGQILRVLAKHGLSRFVRGRGTAIEGSADRRELARSLRRALEDGGVTFTKLGQQLSTRRDLVPPEFVAELSRLQDDAVPIPWPQVAAAIEADLGRPVAEVFASIEPEPLGAASIGQVHAAVLRDGRDVVVKVQRPGIGEQVERDLDIVRRLAHTLSQRTEWARSLGLRDLADGFALALSEELDFTVEADNMVAVGQSLAGTAGLVTPEPILELSGERLLVMTRMTGTALGSAEPVLAALGPARRGEIADTLLTVVLDQILDTGIFHVDLHPGNLLVHDDGTLVMLDLGSVGRLGGTSREAVGRLLAAVGTGDSRTATDTLLELVTSPESVDERALEQEVGAILLRVTGAKGAAAKAFTSLFRLVSTHHLGIPPELAAVFRAVGTLEGTLTIIDPDYDLIGRVQAMSGERITQELTPERLKATALREAAAILPLVRRLPRRIDRLADVVETGRLRAQVRLFADESDRAFVAGLWHRALVTLLSATAGIMGVVLLTIGPGPLVTEDIGLWDALGVTMICVAVILALRVLIAAFGSASARR